MHLPFHLPIILHPRDLLFQSSANTFNPDPSSLFSPICLHWLPAHCMLTPGGYSSVGRNHTGAHTNTQNPTVWSPSLLPPGVIANLCWFPRPSCLASALSEAAETLLPISRRKRPGSLCFCKLFSFTRTEVLGWGWDPAFAQKSSWGAGRPFPFQRPPRK